mmetsp:Transcript_29172/g.64480  ORF Transcript_29172/g.64480 Transcript_29172/m.64480 type:complete len:219 (-) Transcript_29172:1458-2114(-)
MTLMVPWGTPITWKNLACSCLGAATGRIMTPCRGSGAHKVNNAHGQQIQPLKFNRSNNQTQLPSCHFHLHGTFKNPHDSCGSCCHTLWFILTPIQVYKRMCTLPGSVWVCLDLPGSMGNLYEGADVTWVTLVVLSTPSAQSQITRDPACRSLYMADATQGAGIYKDLHGVYMHAGHEDIKSGVIQSGHLECQIYNILGFDISQEISCANLISKARSRS